MGSLSVSGLGLEVYVLKALKNPSDYDLDLTDKTPSRKKPVKFHEEISK